MAVTIKSIAKLLESAGYTVAAARDSGDASELIHVRLLRGGKGTRSDTLYIAALDELPALRSGSAQRNVLCVTRSALPSWCRACERLNLYAVWQDRATLETVSAEVCDMLLSEFSNEAARARLITQLANAASLDELMYAAASFMKKPLLFINLNRNVLASGMANSSSGAERDPLWMQILKTGRVDFALADQSVTNNTEVILKTERKSFFGSFPGTNIAFRKISKENGPPLGTLMVFASGGLLTGQDRETLDIVAPLLESFIAREYYYRSQEQRSFELFTISLLDGRLYDKRAVSEQLGREAISEQSAKRLLTISLSDSDAGADYRQLLNRLEPLEQDRVFQYDNHLLLVTAREMDCHDPGGAFPLLQPYLSETCRCACVSRVFRDFAQIRPRYLQTRRALRFAQLSGASPLTGGIRSYDDFLVFYAFEPFDKEFLLEELCLSSVIELDKYDRMNNAELVRTLRVYIQNGRNAPKTAAELFVHRNTVLYRINKCLATLGLDLDNGSDLLNLLLSLKALEYAELAGGRDIKMQ